jgi:hypothetical protein
MNVRSTGWLSALIAGLLLAGPAIAEDARPQTDEKCIERCDAESDKCMNATDGDPDKMQVCDDKYSECLEACEANG